METEKIEADATTEIIPADAEPEQAAGEPTTGEDLSESSKQEEGTGSQSPALQEMAASLSSLATLLQQLQGDFRARIAGDEYKEKIIDRLHTELQIHKNDLVGQLLKPVLTDMIRLHDDLARVLQDFRAKADPALNDILHVTESFPDDIVDILSRQGLEPFHAEPGTAFDPRIQSVIGKLPTSDTALDKTVTESVRPGFMAGERVFRRNLVRIYFLTLEESSKPNFPPESSQATTH